MTDFSETIGGVTVKDPYRWLEDDTSATVIEWQRSEDARTADALACSPHAAAVAKAVRSTFEDLVAYSTFRHCSDKWFRTVVPAGAARAVLMVSSSPAAEGRVLFDPAAYGDAATLLTYAPAPDATKVAVQVRTGSLCRLVVVDTADGSIVRDFGEVMPTGIDWSPDGAGFYLRKFGAKVKGDGTAVPESQIWWQPLAGEAVQQALHLEDLAAWTITAADGRWMAVCANQGAPRPVWLRRLDGDGWTRFLPGSTAMLKGAFVGDEYWAITDDKSGWCRLVAIPLASADDRSTWRELIADREEVKLGAVQRCGNYVAVTTIESGCMQLRSFDITGREVGRVPLPSDGAVGTFAFGHLMVLVGGEIVAPDGDGCTFVHSSLDRAPGVYRADLATLSVEVLEAPRCILADRVVETLSAKGPDGPVPYKILRKASTPLDGTAPVIVTGYGGFNVPHVPHYLPMAAAWTELGGIWVHAHLRGGGERDTAFWHAGRMHRKQGTFDDFRAVVEDLNARGFAKPVRTGVWGTSNGGLLVGAAVTQWPGLLRAAVAQVPILDMLQMRKDPTTLATALNDYGNPDDPADAPVLHAYSPVHNVRTGVRYPAVLCDAGAQDVSCPPWHSRKMIAALKDANAAGTRLLLRVREGAGHNLMTSEMLALRDIDELTFFCDELIG